MNFHSDSWGQFGHKPDYWGLYMYPLRTIVGVTIFADHIEVHRTEEYGRSRGITTCKYPATDRNIQRLLAVLPSLQTECKIELMSWKRKDVQWQDLC